MLTNFGKLSRYPEFMLLIAPRGNNYFALPSAPWTRGPNA